MSKLFDFLKPKNTSSLEKYYETQAYQKQKLQQSKEKGTERAKAEAKQEKQEIRTRPTVKSGFSKLQDFADNFANTQQKQGSMFGDMSFGGDNGKNNRINKGSRKRSSNRS